MPKTVIALVPCKVGQEPPGTVSSLDPDGCDEFGVPTKAGSIESLREALAVAVKAAKRTPIDAWLESLPTATERILAQALLKVAGVGDGFGMIASGLAEEARDALRSVCAPVDEPKWTQKQVDAAKKQADEWQARFTPVDEPESVKAEAADTTGGAPYKDKVGEILKRYHCLDRKGAASRLLEMPKPEAVQAAITLSQRLDSHDLRILKKTVGEVSTQTESAEPAPEHPRHRLLEPAEDPGELLDVVPAPAQPGAPSAATCGGASRRRTMTETTRIATTWLVAVFPRPSPPLSTSNPATAGP